MNLIEEIKEALRMEIRSNSQGSEYLEAVIPRSGDTGKKPTCRERFRNSLILWVDYGMVNPFSLGKRVIK